MSANFQIIIFSWASFAAPVDQLRRTASSRTRDHTQSIVVHSGSEKSMTTLERNPGLTMKGMEEFQFFAPRFYRGASIFQKKIPAPGVKLCEISNDIMRGNMKRENITVGKTKGQIKIRENGK